MIGRHDGDPLCPHCRAVADGFQTMQPVPDRAPRDGDYSICFYCRTLSIYTLDPITRAVSFRTPTDVELIEAIKNVEIRSALMLPS